MKKYIIILILGLALFGYVDYDLSYYGKGYNIFNTKITYDFNTDFDPLEGFKIEEEGFIQVIGYGTTVSDDSLLVNRITDYAYNSNGIFCKIYDEHRKTYFVKVVYNPNGIPGYKIEYDTIAESKLDKNLKWLNVDNSKEVRNLEITHFLLQVFLLPYILFLTIKILKEQK